MSTIVKNSARNWVTTNIYHDKTRVELLNIGIHYFIQSKVNTKVRVGLFRKRHGLSPLGTFHILVSFNFSHRNFADEYNIQEFRSEFLEEQQYSAVD